VQSKFRRRIRETFTQDWLEILVTVLGVLFLVLGAVFLYALITLVVHYNDPNTGIPIGEGLYKTSKGFGLALFSVGALLFFLVGWAFAGSTIRRRARALLRRRSQTPR
jgi:membrane-associated protease RseP (regulator of RpoE activity)